jgi:hypothetical protein
MRVSWIAAERGNAYYTYDFNALAVCEVVYHWRPYLEGCLNFLVVSHHDTLRQLLSPHQTRINILQARYVRDLQPFVGLMTLAYRKGALNEANPFSRIPSFAPRATVS